MPSQPLAARHGARLTSSRLAPGRSGTPFRWSCWTAGGRVWPGPRRRATGSTLPWEEGCRERAAKGRPRAKGERTHASAERRSLLLGRAIATSLACSLGGVLLASSAPLAAVPHTVLPGETLWSISTASNLTTRTVASTTACRKTRCSSRGRPSLCRRSRRARQRSRPGRRPSRRCPAPGCRQAPAIRPPKARRPPRQRSRPPPGWPTCPRRMGRPRSGSLGGGGSVRRSGSSCRARGGGAALAAHRPRAARAAELLRNAAATASGPMLPDVRGIRSSLRSPSVGVSFCTERYE